ncbi:MAG: hypothetical protein B7Y99_05850 [Caulobacterales bacterium 32-69-10]|nr:MAG: hypothetical protein B7Y99_05850 [Caulobacterales bacterium 32-69-10]
MMAKTSGIAACALASAMLIAASAAPAYAAGAPYKAPRNGFGQPDLSGTWSNETLTRMERQPQYGDRIVPTPEEIAAVEGLQAKKVEVGKSGVNDTFRAECETPAGAFNIQCAYDQAFFDDTSTMMRVGGQPRNSFITYPANGRIPRRPDKMPTGNAFGVGNTDNPENRGLPDRCLVGQNISTGALLNPTIYNNTYLFQQNKDAVVIVVEMSHDARTVRLNAKHDNIPRWFGDSVGHWEGDTLVVDTINFHPLQLGLNTPQLHLVERFTRVGPQRILYQFRVEDPGAYTAPWGGEYEFHAAKGLQYEYACHEGNHAMSGILAGARQEEEKARAGAALQPAKTGG